MQRIVVHAEFLQGFRTGIRNEDVRLGDELHGNLQAFGILRIHADQVLVRVVQVERGVFRLGVLCSECRALGALCVAYGSLDLDDLGAHVGQDANRCGTGHVRAHLDDFDARKRAIAVQMLGSCHMHLLLSHQLIYLVRYISIVLQLQYTYSSIWCFTPYTPELDRYFHIEYFRIH